MSQYQSQQQTMSRTQSFLQQYGMKKSWLAKKISIPNSVLSAFINEKAVLSTTQHERLLTFMAQWDTCMDKFNEQEVK